MRHVQTLNSVPIDFNPLNPNPVGVVRFQQELVYEAIVVDVIVNDSHPEYATDGYNVGALRFRNIKTDMYRDVSQLNWAFPMDANISEYPLKGEIVCIYTALNRFYYSRKLNTSNNVSGQVLPGLNEEMGKPVNEAIPRHAGATASPIRENVNKRQNIGSYFEDKKLPRLRHDEGDVVFEGRSGQSIRFGASWTARTNFRSATKNQAPVMLFRVGPDTVTTPQTVENIDSDASSLYLTTDMIVPLHYATENLQSTHRASIEDFPKRLDGPQIVMNTERFVVNARKDKIMGFALNGIHWTSGKDASVDAERDYRSHIGRDSKVTVVKSTSYKTGDVFIVDAGHRISLKSPKVYLGTETDESQPVPCGAELADFLEQLIKIFTTNAANFIQGSKAITPSAVAQLAKLQQKVAQGAKAPFNSHKVYTAH